MGELRSPPKYWSRKLTCPVCSEQIETAQMQLFTSQGLRNINCSKCATQKGTKGWKCECGSAWHTCDIHRNDPTVHRSTKPPAALKKSDESKETSFKDSDRKAPESAHSTTHRPQKKTRVSVTLHTHEVPNHMQETDIRSKNLLERIRTKFAARNDPSWDRESKGGGVESRKDLPEIRKRNADIVEHQCSSKKLKSDSQAQPDSQPIARTRKRLREELEERIDDLRFHQARTRDDEGQHRETRRPKTERKGDDLPEATFEAAPQIPGRLNGTQKILERLRSRSKRMRDLNSTNTCKDIHMHERDAIARLLNGGGTPSSTDRGSSSGACGVGTLALA